MLNEVRPAKGTCGHVSNHSPKQLPSQKNMGLTVNLKRPSTTAWTVVHLVYPLLPAFLEAGIRLVALDWTLGIDTMNAATLAMLIGIVALFVNQSIRTEDTALADAEERDSRNGACVVFAVCGIVFFVLFAIVVLLQTVVVDRKMVQLASTLHAFQLVVFVGCVAPIVFAIAAQRSFKLRTAIV